MDGADKPTLTTYVRQGFLVGFVALCAGGYFTLSTCSPQQSVLSQIRQLGVLRVATVNSPTTYYQGPTGPTGFEYDLAKGLADRLGVRLELIVASTPPEALKLVRQNKAHFAAAGIAITEGSSHHYRFSQPLLSVVPQLVYRMGQPKPKDLADLHGRLRIVRGSSEAEHLRELKATKFPDLRWEETDDQESEELLYMVANEELHYTIANSDVLAINQRYYPMLRAAFPMADAQDLAWAFPLTDDASLFDLAGDYLHDVGGAELARLRDRYFGHIEQVGYYGAVTLATDTESRLPRYRKNFEAAGSKFGVDWRLLAAMGYQESRWDPSATSPTGVKGIMQLTLDTAAVLNVINREDPAQSILGGARYISQLAAQLPASILEPDRTWMSLAAYNIGIGHLLDARELTQQLGGDPNRWLDVRNSLPLLTQSKWHSLTKHGYARGHEAVTYVGNIRTFYDMLMWLTGGTPPQDVSEEQHERRNDKKKDKDPLNISSPVL
jgi:membrane-bound lytic murein transglycosylase F